MIWVSVILLTCNTLCFHKWPVFLFFSEEPVINTKKKILKTETITTLKILAALCTSATFIDYIVLLNWVLLALFFFSGIRLFLSVLVEEIMFLFGK